MKEAHFSIKGFMNSHRLKDTLALLFVFVSFNNVMALCLLTSFIVASSSGHCLSSFVAKMVWVLNGTCGNKRYVISNSIKTKSLRFTWISGRVISRSKGSYRLVAFELINGWVIWLLRNRMIVGFEIIMACMLKKFGCFYFRAPIENLALSIIASNLLNSQKDLLSYATKSSIVYSLSLKISQRISTYCGYSPNISVAHSQGSVQGIVFIHPLRGTVSGRLISLLGNYIPLIRYALSFHVVVSQFYLNMRNSPRETCQSPLTFKESSNSTETSARDLNSFCVVETVAVASSSSQQGKLNTDTEVSGATTIEAVTYNPEPKVMDSSIHTSELAPAAITSSVNPQNYSNKLMQTPVGQQQVSKPASARPAFTNIIREFKVSEFMVTLPLHPQGKKNVNPSALIATTASPTEEPLDTRRFRNQCYELSLNDDNALEPDDYPCHYNVATSIAKANMENLIRRLFWYQKRYIIPILWSMFTIIRIFLTETTWLNGDENNIKETIAKHYTPAEGYYCQGTKELDVNPDHDATAIPSSEPDGSKLDANISNCKSEHGEHHTRPVVFSDHEYHKLHVVQNSLQYKRSVCLADIGSNVAVFWLEEQLGGSLIVLVNGIIWLQVSSKIVHPSTGVQREQIVISGLVPSYSYNIELFERVNNFEDYFITELLIRTASKDTGKLDYSESNFISYYHKQLISPAFSLKQAVITANVDLSEERLKLKKTKRDISRKTSSMKQELEQLKAKLAYNASQDEKSAYKIDNLKTALLQSSEHNLTLEENLKFLKTKQQSLEAEYLESKDTLWKQQLDFQKTENSLKKNLQLSNTKLAKLQHDIQQYNTKRDKLLTKHLKLRTELSQYEKEFLRFKEYFLQNRNKERNERQQIRLQKSNELELKIKGLEQDISRLERENILITDLVHPN
ncbi:Nnf2p Ecym_4454 [Eremothecium cymbalariae DBVPG|uniref:Uncharacterized protein n=1 Tax=Eremothecium cymbalariae (strain CBS 270.75 / DBVPG 7215 / KCTC 17166 / NRRL Y-17582) TaxID=931890 RepID=G8JTZ5_ERECY|nr:hypothetical protein Ecym_4454 [Eremothecium cymbalariae DBVPG\